MAKHPSMVEKDKSVVLAEIASRQPEFSTADSCLQVAADEQARRAGELLQPSAITQKLKPRNLGGRLSGRRGAEVIIELPQYPPRCPSRRHLGDSDLNRRGAH